MLAKPVRALGAGVRNSSSSCHLGACCGLSRRMILVELCFDAVNSGQCTEQTRRRKTVSRKLESGILVNKTSR